MLVLLYICYKTRYLTYFSTPRLIIYTTYKTLNIEVIKEEQE